MNPANLVGCATPQDDRIDPELLALNQRATRALPDYVGEVRIEREGTLPVHFEQLWLVYLAANIYGNADSALILMTHNRGREARGSVRNMYENLTKAEYFIEHPDDARLEYLAMPFRDERFQRQMQQPENGARMVAARQAIATITERWPEVAAYAEQNRDSKSLYQMVLSSNNGDQASTDHEYSFHYRRPSQNPHATVAGMEDIFEYPNHDQVGVYFDGRVADPNFDIQLSTIYLLTFLQMLNDVFALGHEAEVREMQDASAAIRIRIYGPDNTETVDLTAPPAQKRTKRV